MFPFRLGLVSSCSETKRPEKVAAAASIEYCVDASRAKQYNTGNNFCAYVNYRYMEYRIKDHRGMQPIRRRLNIKWTLILIFTKTKQYFLILQTLVHYDGEELELK
jgi:hypothetical protein